VDEAEVLAEVEVAGSAAAEEVATEAAALAWVEASAMASVN
jgi:hypothetical protein